jgi:hypothetical protein
MVGEARRMEVALIGLIGVLIGSGLTLFAARLGRESEKKRW